MKALYHLLSLAAIACTAASCQKVIDVSPKVFEPRIVIEGEITDAPGPYIVSITRTRSITDDNAFEPLSAQVVIRDLTAGITDTLSAFAPGKYRTALIVGQAGHQYELTAAVDGKVFSATSAIPTQAVDIDSLYAAKPDFGGDNYYIFPVFTDPGGSENYYRLRQWIRGQLIGGSVVRSDRNRDGLVVRSPLGYDTDEESGNPLLRAGDSIRVELQSINRAAYDYYRTLSNVTGYSITTPANPLTNISGGALGVFNTCLSRSKADVARF